MLTITVPVTVDGRTGAPRLGRASRFEVPTVACEAAVPAGP